MHSTMLNFSENRIFEKPSVFDKQAFLQARPQIKVTGFSVGMTPLHCCFPEAVTLYFVLFCLPFCTHVTCT